MPINLQCEKTPACPSRTSNNLGQFSIFSVCWLSLDIKVHTLIAKSCSFGNGDISDIIKRSYSVDLYKSVDNLWIIRRPSTVQKLDYHSYIETSVFFLTWHHVLTIIVL